MGAQALVDLAAEQAAAAAAANIPKAGPDTPVQGDGPGADWDTYYNWIEHKATKLRNDVENAVGKIGPFITNEIQGYIGYTLQAIGTFINNLHLEITQDWESWFNYALAQERVLGDELDHIADVTGSLVGDNYELREVILPALLQRLAELDQQIKVAELESEANQQRWAEDNIYLPLYDQIQLHAIEQRQYTDDVATVLHVDTTQQVHDEQQQRIAALLLLAQQVNRLQVEQDECTQPMCDVMGPKTDLGKFLKALQFAAGAATLAELAALDKDGIESLLRGLQHLASGVIDDIGAIFTGGETVGEAIGGIIGL